MRKANWKLKPRWRRPMLVAGCESSQKEALKCNNLPAFCYPQVEGWEKCEAPSHGDTQNPLRNFIQKIVQSSGPFDEAPEFLEFKSDISIFFSRAPPSRIRLAVERKFQHFHFFFGVIGNENFPLFHIPSAALPQKRDFSSWQNTFQLALCCFPRFISLYVWLNAINTRWWK